MQLRDSAQITPREWRWVLIMGCCLILLSLLPYIWLAFNMNTSNRQFMGALNDHINSAAYLSRIAQGEAGSWLLFFQHTPETHNGTLIHLLYLILGQLSRLLSVPPIVIYHVARVGAAMFMYAAIYQMGAMIWLRLRTRRIFFAFASVGAGFGWLMSLISGNPDYPDLTILQAFPLSSTFTNVHLPLSIGCLALLVSVIVMAFRPGMSDDPSVTNGGLLAALLSLTLALLYAEALLPFGLALLAYIVVYTYTERHISLRTFRWLMVIVLPAVPVGTYYLVVGASNWAVANWSAQNVQPMPNLLALAIGLGIPLLAALPGILRAVRRFEPDGDQFILVWIIAMLALAYLPTAIQSRFLLGLMLPIGYFAARSIEDFWFQHMRGRLRYRILAAVLPVVIISHLVTLFAPTVAANGSNGRSVLLNRDYTLAFEWLRIRTQPTDVVLAAPNVGVWLPVWSGARTVYGHPAETLGAAGKHQSVLNWYSDPTVDCAALLEGRDALVGSYQVRYILFGPEERALGESVCLAELDEVWRTGSVIIYSSPYTAR